MVFTTLKFIIFMAVVFLLYYLIPKGRQWQLLLVASYVFYAFASPVYLVFLIFTTAVTYFGGVLIDNEYKKQECYLSEHKAVLSKEDKKSYKDKIKKQQTIKITIVITLLLLMLGIFKYSDFIANIFANLMSMFGVSVEKPNFNLILPIGLSFYMFQSLGYCIDVYREMAEAEHNFFKHALYVSFFPQLLQGPIGDYNRLSPQLFKEHSFEYEPVKMGLQRVAWGFFKKLVIANQISLMIDTVWLSYNDYSGCAFWMFILCLYAIQLYADFSGYMDIALGCGKMLGISLDENFEAPYLSKNIAEFWRRWHITLGTWFKNYVFYPVLRTKLCDGIRKKNRKTHPYISNTIPNVIALLIVWTLIGLWHGADWSYVVYGLYHGSFIILSTLLAPVYAKIDSKFPGKQTNRAYSLFQIGRTFLIVTLGYVIFRPANLSVTANILNGMTSSLGIHDLLHFGHANIRELCVVALGTLGLLGTDIYKIDYPSDSILIKLNNKKAIIRWIVYIVLLLSIIFLGAYGESGLNQFAYFRF